MKALRRLIHPQRCKHMDFTLSPTKSKSEHNLKKIKSGFYSDCVEKSEVLQPIMEMSRNSSKD